MTAMNVTEYLEADHRRIDRLLTEAIESAAAGALDQALRAFATFREQIEKHIDLEERFLFPFFEEANGASGPTQVMRAEHARILKAADGISVRLKGDPLAYCLEELDSLTRLLSAHNLKEERVLYPATERVLQALGRRDEVLQEMQRERSHSMTSG
jgi:hemerythrin-like domain-containing protein